MSGWFRQKPVEDRRLQDFVVCYDEDAKKIRPASLCAQNFAELACGRGNTDEIPLWALFHIQSLGYDVKEIPMEKAKRNGWISGPLPPFD